MRYLGVDYGEKRVGIAISDPLGILASPLKIIKHNNNDDIVVEELLKMVENFEVEKVIIGLPYNMNGSIGFQAERVIQFSEYLKTRTNIELIFEDERESSKQVKDIIKKIKSKSEQIDDRAAAIILQNYLDYN